MNWARVFHCVIASIFMVSFAGCSNGGSPPEEAPPPDAITIDAQESAGSGEM